MIALSDSLEDGKEDQGPQLTKVQFRFGSF